MRSSPSGPQRRERNAALGCSAWARPCCWQRRIEWSSQTGVRPGGRVRFADRSRSDLFIWHVHGFRRACRRVRRPRAAVGARMTVAPAQPGHVCSRPCVDGLVATRRLLPPRAERSHPRRAHGPGQTHPPAPAVRRYQGSGRPRRPGPQRRTPRFACCEDRLPRRGRAQAVDHRSTVRWRPGRDIKPVAARAWAGDGKKSAPAHPRLDP
jgi:hypothetical protein